MTNTVLTPEAKDALRKAVRTLRAGLVVDFADAAKSEYQLDVSIEKSRLSASRRGRRQRLDAWIDEQVRSAGAERAKGTQAADLRTRFFAQAAREAAHTLLNRLVFLRILEHHGLV